MSWRQAPGTDGAAPGPLFEGNPVGEGTTRRGTATPVHRPQRPAGSTHSSTRGLRPPEYTVGARGPAQGLCGGLSGLLGRDRIHRGKKLSLKTKEWPLGAKGKQAAAAETQELKEKGP